ncbi:MULTISPECIES: maleylpyruvate isomerase family mycothiol-dependent enzyme [unclassified Janibacter]|uniref:maleylpyruvate isomerase family mycothiol-dependent enzyme n=1 Tax=unclassified Janibacter TaxID=2649294 RepID=UPI003D08D0E5
MDRDQLDAAIASHTARLITTVEGLTGPEDLRAPTRCPGWSRGHVLAHLARNADALGGVAGDVAAGRPALMYSSQTQRDADIEAGATRPQPEALADLRDTAEAARAQLRLLGPEHDDVAVPRTPGGATFPVRRVPFMRLREVVYHHADLEAGFDFEDVEDELAMAFIGEEVARLKASTPGPAFALAVTDATGATAREWSVHGGGPLVSGGASGLLAWLARQDVSGVTSEALPTLPKGG